MVALWSPLCCLMSPALQQQHMRGQMRLADSQKSDMCWKSRRQHHSTNGHSLQVACLVWQASMAMLATL